MTEKEKDLLIKDLSARLPYGVKIVIQDTFKYSIVLREYHVLEVSNFSDIFCFNYKKFDKSMKKAMRERPNDIVIKPYLFPMSSMTEEQARKLSILYGIKNILSKKITDEYIEFEVDDGFGDVEIRTIWYNEIVSSIETFDWLNKNHFDFRGLIPMNLAIDATGLNIY